MGRAPCCDKANVKRGPWSPEEDHKLKSYIEKHGTGGNWIALPQKIGLKRCGKSCRLRWLNYLRPNIRHGGFTEDEDDLICSLYISIGSRWSIIAAQLPGRTDNDIKNYWNTRLKKKLLGRQRREQQQARCATKQSLTKRPVQNYAINDASPPLLQVVYSNIINSPVGATFSFEHVPQSNNLCYNSFPQIQHLPSNNSTSIINSSSPSLGSDFHGISGIQANDFQAFNETPQDLFYSLPQQLDGSLGSLSAVDVMNSSTAGWGDISYNLGYPSYYEISQRKMAENRVLLFDEPRLLGYSE